MGPLLTFDTTHHAIWAEQVALEHGLAAQVVPAPADSSAGCDLALETLPEDVARLEQELGARKIAYARYR